MATPGMRGGKISVGWTGVDGDVRRTAFQRWNNPRSRKATSVGAEAWLVISP